MPTVVNEMILEPKAPPPAVEAATKAAGTEKGSAASPEMERKVEHVMHRARQRAMRLCVY